MSNLALTSQVGQVARPLGAQIDGSPQPTVGLCESVQAFAAMRAEWSGLVERSGAGPFCLWEWLYPWHQRIAPDGALHILMARAGDRLQGLLPLYMDRMSAMGRTVRRLAFLGESDVGSEYLDVIASPTEREEVISAFADRLLMERDRWDVLDLVDIDSESPTLRVLKERFSSRGYRVEITPRSGQPYERWEPGESFEAYMRRTTRRKNWFRDLRWLERQPGGHIEVVTDPRDVPQALTTFLRLHRLRWEESGGSDAVRGPSVEAFHRDAMQFLAERGKLALFVMKLEGKGIAMIYSLRHGDTFYYYQSGRDPAWNHRSVSAACLAATIRDAMQHGLQEYDMLSGPEPYKLEWVTRMRHSRALRVYNPSGPGRHFVRQERLTKLARAFAKRALPRPLADKVRKMRDGRHG